MGQLLGGLGGVQVLAQNAVGLAYSRDAGQMHLDQVAATVSTADAHVPLANRAKNHGTRRRIAQVALEVLPGATVSQYH